MPSVASPRTWITLALVGGLPLAASFLLERWGSGGRWEHQPLHALVEGLGALIAVIVAALVHLMRRSGRGTPALLWVTCALLGMGLLDGFHAATYAGQAFVWLHCVATLVGGVLFACVWLPDAAAQHPKMQKLPIIIIVLATYLGVVSLALPDRLPVMVTAAGFTPAAKALNLLGGIGFLAAAAAFVCRRAALGREENVLFAHHCLLFGVAGLVFTGSVLWEASWWSWHVLRLAAYLVVLVYFFHVYRQALQEARETALGLEQQVADRTRELTAGMEARRQAEEALARQNRDLEQAEHALRESAEHTRSLLDSTAEAIYGIDLEGRCTFCNRACVHLLGYPSPADLIGRNMHALIHHTHADGTPYPVEHCPIYGAFRSGTGAHGFDDVFWRADGTCFPVEYWSYPLWRGDGVVGAVVTFLDITERKRVEKELHDAHLQLELRVAERTRELSTLNAALETRARQLRALTEAALAINSASTFEEVMQVLTDQACQVIGAHQAVTSFTRDRNWAQALTGLSLSDKYAAYRSYDARPDGSGIYALVCETNRPMRLTQAELEAHPRWRGFGTEVGRHPPLVGWLAVPLLAGDGSNLGLIQLSDKYEGDFSEEDQHLLVQLAHIGSSALEIRKTRAELEARVRERTAQLRASKERMDLALQSSGVGTWDWNIVENTIIWDDYLHPLFGLAPGTFPGKYEDFLATLHPEDRRRVADEVAAAVDADAPYDTEYRVIWPDGSVHVLGSRGKVYRDGQGRAVQMTGVCWDETARQRAEEDLRRVAVELARSNAELEQFASIASHDLQEPLRKVQAFGDLLATHAGEALDATGRLYVERMQDAARRMQNLITDLLTFARVTSQARAFAEVDLARVARDVVSDLEARIKTTNGRVEIGELPCVEGDATQLRQLLQNLIGNALKFHRDGVPPVVGVRGRIVPNSHSGLRESLPAARAEVTVADNGIGFEERYLEQIFAPFKRLHGQGKFEGTGMGLAICRKIVERHQGSITAHSTPGQGTTFIITLPVRQPRGDHRHG